MWDYWEQLFVRYITVCLLILINDQLIIYTCLFSSLFLGVAIADCLLCHQWQCSVTRPHPEFGKTGNNQSEAVIRAPRPMRGLHGRCHGNVRICGKLVASAGNSISHIPALLWNELLITVDSSKNGPFIC